MPGLSEKTPLRASSAASSSELPGATVAAYAAPSVPSSARDVFVTLYLRKFYIDYLGIPPGRLAVVDASVHAAHYFTAIFAGVMVDSTNNSFGRRRTHILIWTFVVAIAFSLLFCVPDGSLRGVASGGGWPWAQSIVWYGVLKVIYDVAPLGLAWQALGPELTQQVEERNRLYAVTQCCHWLGNLFGGTLPALLVAALGRASLRLAFVMTSIVISAFLLSFFLLLVWVVAEPQVTAARNSPFDAVPALRNAFRNRAFVALLLLDLLYAIQQALSSGLAVFFVQRPSGRKGAPALADDTSHTRARARAHLAHSHRAKTALACLESHAARRQPRAAS